jgi:hypothetical protein
MNRIQRSRYCEELDRPDLWNQAMWLAQSDHQRGDQPRDAQGQDRKLVPSSPSLPTGAAMLLLFAPC